MSDVLDSDMELLGNLSLLDLFLDDNSNRSWIDIEDFSSSSMVKMVWHTFMDSSINDDVNVVSKSVLFEIVVHSDSSMSSEAFGKLMSGS